MKVQALISNLSLEAFKEAKIDEKLFHDFRRTVVRDNTFDIRHNNIVKKDDFRKASESKTEVYKEVKKLNEHSEKVTNMVTFSIFRNVD